MPLPALSQWPDRKPYTPRLVGGRRGGGHRLWLPAVAIHRLHGRRWDSLISSSLFSHGHPCAQSVKSSPTEPVLSKSIRRRLASGWWWNSWCLTSVVCRVRSMRQATVLLMWGGALTASRRTLSKFVGLRQLKMIRLQSCRRVQLVRVCRPCPHRAGVFGSWVAEAETAGSECRCLAPPLRVREFTDDVIYCVHLIFVFSTSVFYITEFGQCGRPDTLV